MQKSDAVKRKNNFMNTCTNVLGYLAGSFAINTEQVGCELSAKQNKKDNRKIYN